MARDDPDPLRRAMVGARARSMPVAFAWRETDAMRHVMAAFDDIALADADTAADRARALLGDGGLVAALLALLVAALAADPWFEPPFKVQRDRARIGAALLDHPAARLGASVTSARAIRAQAPAAVVVPGRISVTRYHRAGRATLKRWDAGRVVEPFRAAFAPPARVITALRPADGDVVIHDGRRHGFTTTEPDVDVVAATILIRAGAEPLMREYRVADGRLLRATTTDDGASRGSMLLTLLRVSGRADAGLLFEAASRDPGFHARWGAMREWLALDATAARPRLAEMAADDPHVEVRAAAVATLALIERTEAARCPA